MDKQIINKIYSRKDTLVSRKVGNEYLLVPVIKDIADMNNMFTLNEVGSFIWDQVNGKKCVKEIIESVHSEFDVDRKTAENDVMDFFKKTEKVLFV